MLILGVLRGTFFIMNPATPRVPITRMWPYSTPKACGSHRKSSGSSHRNNDFSRGTQLLSGPLGLLSVTIIDGEYAWWIGDHEQPLNSFPSSRSVLKLDEHWYLGSSFTSDCSLPNMSPVWCFPIHQAICDARTVQRNCWSVYFYRCIYKHVAKITHMQCARYKHLPIYLFIYLSILYLYLYMHLYWYSYLYVKQLYTCIPYGVYLPTFTNEMTLFCRSPMPWSIRLCGTTNIYQSTSSGFWGAQDRSLGIQVARSAMALGAFSEHWSAWRIWHRRTSVYSEAGWVSWSKMFTSFFQINPFSVYHTISSETSTLQKWPSWAPNLQLNSAF